MPVARADSGRWPDSALAGTVLTDTGWPESARNQTPPAPAVVSLSVLRVSALCARDEATLAGATVLPPVPGFYHRPSTIQEVIDQTVTKILDLFGIHLDLIQRWQGL